MNGKQKPALQIEVLNGPLDGANVVLSQETEWTGADQGQLSFPWDKELGQPQARFRLEADGWTLEGYKAPHGTYRLNKAEKIAGPTAIAAGDLLKASGTWLLVQKIE
ncbi:MAG: hypothetical protein WA029_15090 [Anaerolineae bacterium]